ncbi:MAG: T9SS type A sorting domain-containing protein [bacterium]
MKTSKGNFLRQSVLGFITFLTFILTILTAPVYAQGVAWQRRVQAYCNGRDMAFYHGGMEYVKPVLVDIDNDGDGDLFVGEHDGFLNFFENRGGNPPHWFCISTALDTIDVGKQNAPTFWDVDIDGDFDLFIGDEDGDLWFYRNEGSVSSPIWTLQTQCYIAPLLVDHHAIPFFRDLDGDGDDDLLIGHNEGGAAHFLNVGVPGNPAWSHQTDFYQDIDVGDKSSVCVYDADADSLQDVFMGSLNGEIRYFHNDGPLQNPTYSDSGAVFDVGQNSAPTFWDLDDDGDLDLIAGESDGNLNLVKNVGSTTAPLWEFVQGNVGYLDLGFHSKCVFADLDNDGDSDLLAGRIPGGLVFYENIGTPDSAAWFLVSNNYNNINLPGWDAPAFYDLDADGDFDLLIGCSADSLDGTLVFYRNVGTAEDPEWAAPIYNYAGIQTSGNAAPAFGDLDADGDADLIVGAANGTVHYVRNNGSPLVPIWEDLGNSFGIDVGSFATPTLADLDEDNDLDMMIGNGGLTGNIAFYRNIGSVGFPQWFLEASYYNNWDLGDYSCPALADLDHDDDADLFIGCESGGIYCFENLGAIFDIDIFLLPYNPPIVVPEEGGIIQYILQLVNNEPRSHFVNIWMTLTLPHGEVVGPVDSLSANLNSGITSELRTFEVLDTLPGGEYYFNGAVGIYPNLVYSTHSFLFIKEPWVSVEEPEAGGESLNLDFRLERPFPNPFNSETLIRYSLARACPVSLTVFDVRGRRVADLVQKWQSAGRYTTLWRTTEQRSGVYFIRLHAGDYTATLKVCLLQ